jgi:hypothetical protein
MTPRGRRCQLIACAHFLTFFQHELRDGIGKVVMGRPIGALCSRNKVKRLWLASLKRRSQMARLSRERFIQLVARFFPPIRTLHPRLVTASAPKTRGRSPVR